MRLVVAAFYSTALICQVIGLLKVKTPPLPVRVQQPAVLHVLTTEDEDAILRSGNGRALRWSIVGVILATVGGLLSLSL
mgnify:CR=1 FL=1